MTNIFNWTTINPSIAYNKLDTEKYIFDQVDHLFKSIDGV